jgi:hypothetical protein
MADLGVESLPEQVLQRGVFHDVRERRNPRAIRIELDARAFVAEHAHRVHRREGLFFQPKEGGVGRAERIDPGVERASGPLEGNAPLGRHERDG